MDALKKAKVSGEPGTRYEYASLNTYVVTLILEKVTGKPFEDLVTEQIWSQSGMEGDGVLGLTVSGEPSSPGAFAARLRDLARFGMLFTPSWNVVAKKRVVSEQYFAKAKAEDLLKQINAALTYVAYPIAEETGDLLDSRLARPRSVGSPA